MNLQLELIIGVCALTSAASFGQDFYTAGNITGLSGLRGGDPAANNYFFTADQNRTHILSGVLALGVPDTGSHALGTWAPFNLISQDSGGSTFIQNRGERYGYYEDWLTATPYGYQGFASLVAEGHFHPVHPWGGAGGGLATGFSLKTPDGSAYFFGAGISESRWEEGQALQAHSNLVQQGVGALDSTGRAIRSPMFNVASSVVSNAVATEFKFTDTRTANKMLWIRSDTPALGGATAPASATTSHFEIRHPGLAPSAPALLKIDGLANGASETTVNSPTTFNNILNVNGNLKLNGVNFSGFTSGGYSNFSLGNIFSWNQSSSSGSHGGISISDSLGYTSQETNYNFPARKIETILTSVDDSETDAGTIRMTASGLSTPKAEISLGSGRSDWFGTPEIVSVKLSSVDRALLGKGVHVGPQASISGTSSSQLVVNGDSRLAGAAQIDGAVSTGNLSVVGKATITNATFAILNPAPPAAMVPANASVVIEANGDVVVKGALYLAPQGDIPMFDPNAP